ncbi:MAG TPA: hypothetical protein VEF76_03590, partial [Patescibacteria group bacterium]|nr:hypothetical protein [Patescibacteria group bacterium]
MRSDPQAVPARVNKTAPAYDLHHGDLPPALAFGSALAINAEFMGPSFARDRLCALQVYDGNG